MERRASLDCDGFSRALDLAHVSASRSGPGVVDRGGERGHAPSEASGRLEFVAARGAYGDLIREVMASSEASTWDRAVGEWEIAACEEDVRVRSACICGQPHLRYLFTIVNTINGNQLFPIGSVCIEKFGRRDLADEATVREQLFKLMHAIEGGHFIRLSSEYFSRKLLRFLFEDGAFEPNLHNRYDPEADYHFMLDMFNQRLDPTDAQGAKIRAIIVTQIKPYLRQALRRASA
jgi:hypothetical protein